MESSIRAAVSDVSNMIMSNNVIAQDGLVDVNVIQYSLAKC